MDDVLSTVYVLVISPTQLCKSCNKPKSFYCCNTNQECFHSNPWGREESLSTDSYNNPRFLSVQKCNLTYQMQWSVHRLKSTGVGNKF
jgi:hypothetical protein